MPLNQLFRKLLEESVTESLQRLLVSVKTGDTCAKILWCHFGQLLSSSNSQSSSYRWIRAQQFLVYLTLAEMTNVAGKPFTEIVKLHHDGTCEKVLLHESLVTCF